MIPQTLLPIVVGGGVLLLIIYANRHRGGKVKAVLEPLAQRKGGRVGEPGLFSYPKLTYQVDNVEIEMFSRPGSRNSPPFTYVRFQRQSQLKFSIYNESFVSSLGKMIGLSEIQINNREFDDAFVLKSDSEMMFRQLLTANLQQKILPLKNMRPNIQLKDGRFELRIPKIPNTEMEYEVLLSAAEGFIAELKRLM